MPKCIELKAGDQFGSWTVIERGEPDSGGNLRWVCRCQCGKIKSLFSFHLRKRAKTCRSCFMKGRAKPRGNKSPHWTGCGEISGKHWASILRHAKDRGHAVEITVEQAWQLVLDQKHKCKFTGVVLLFGELQTASLDRIDSNLGYTLDNVQWVHKSINLMKGSMSDLELIEWCRLVADRQVSVI